VSYAPTPKKPASVTEPVQNTFEALSREWLSKMAATRSAVTQDKALGWLQHDIPPVIGAMPVAAIKPRVILAVIQGLEARGAIDSAHRMKQMCG
jgi:DNA-binding HxlR family transcriptional regulator